MLSQHCLECGLLENNKMGEKHCLALKRRISQENLNRCWECYFYLPIITEDGEPLTPFEHYLLKMDEIENKKVSIINMALN